jgi:hypothetical protein
MLNTLQQTIDQTYPYILSNVDETPWYSIKAQYKLSDPELENLGCRGSPTQRNSNSNFIAIDIPNLEMGGKDPITGDHDYEPTLPCDNVPDTCSNEVESKLLEDVNSAPYSNKVVPENKAQHRF